MVPLPTRTELPSERPSCVLCDTLVGSGDGGGGVAGVAARRWGDLVVVVAMLMLMLLLMLEGHATIPLLREEPPPHAHLWRKLALP